MPGPSVFPSGEPGVSGGPITSWEIDGDTVEVTNRFEGLDLIDRMLKNYRWRFRTLHRTCDQNHSQEKEMQKSKMVV